MTYPMSSFNRHEDEHVRDVAWTGLSADMPADDPKGEKALARTLYDLAPVWKDLFVKKKKPKKPKQQYVSTPPPSNTGMIVALGLGVLVLGVGGYLIFKKKK